MSASPSAIVITLSMAVSLAGCLAPSDTRHAPPGVQDLAGRFAAVNDASLKRPYTGSFSQHLPVTRKGVRRDSLVLVAPIAVRALLDGISGSTELQGLVTPVFNVGDGIQMDILLTTPTFATIVYSRYYDAGRRAEDRDWIPLAVPLDLSNMKGKFLEIRVSAGPQGNLTADWLALSSLRLVRRNSEVLHGIN